MTKSANAPVWSIAGFEIAVIVSDFDIRIFSLAACEGVD